MPYAQSIELTKEDMDYLYSIIRQRTLEAQIVDHARMLLYKSQACPTVQQHNVLISIQ